MGQVVSFIPQHGDPRLPPTTRLESALVEVFILNGLNLFRMIADEGRPHFAQFWCNISLFRINTCKSVSKQATLTPFTINTYGKQGGWGACRLLPNTPPAARPETQALSFQILAHSFALTKKSTPLSSIASALFAQNTRGGVSLRLPLFSPFLTSLPIYFLTSRRASRAACYTVLPWLANASASTSSPISTGARRSRAPFAFRRIPPLRFRGRTNIAGSKLVRDTAR